MTKKPVVVDLEKETKGHEKKPVNPNNARNVINAKRVAQAKPDKGSKRKKEQETKWVGVVRLVGRIVFHL